MKVFVNGKFVLKSKAKISVFDHGFLYGDAIYETVRVVDGEAWQIGKHMKRLKSSASKIALKIPWNSRQIRAWVLKLVELNKLKSARVRITISRGENGFVFTKAKNPTICIIAQKLKVEPKSVYEKGVKVITVYAERCISEVKSTNMLPVIMARQKVEKKKVYEALLVDRSGFVKEGTITNFYIVKRGVLITPKDGILLGTTRNLILQYAKRFVEVELREVCEKELLMAEEVFLSNAPRGVVPVVMVNGKKVGNGKVGGVTEKLIGVLERKRGE